MTIHAPGPAGAGERGRLHEHLVELLQAVNDWLEFAESKNTTGLTLSSAALAVLIGFERTWSGWVAAVFACSIALLVLSVGASALSFLPQTRAERPRAARSPAAGDNLLYYGHLADYDHRALIDAIADRYLDGGDPTPDRFAQDLALQIVTNARITVRKLRLFRITVLLFAAGTVIGMISVALGRQP